MHSDAASNFCINAFTLLFFFDWQCRHHHQSFVSVKFNYLDLCWLIELAERAVYPLHSTYLFKLFACCATFFQWKWIATGASVWKSTAKKIDFQHRFSVNSNGYNIVSSSLWNKSYREMNITAIIFNERKWKIYRVQFILTPNLSIHSWMISICFFCYFFCVCVSFYIYLLLLFFANTESPNRITQTTTTTPTIHNHTNTCTDFFRFFVCVLKAIEHLYAAFIRNESKNRDSKNQKYLFNRLVSSRSWLHPMTFDVRYNIYTFDCI